jgi:hypothetical protein
VGTPLYFYTPLYSEADNAQPGVDTGSGVEDIEDMPISMNVLKYDEGLDRCVIKVPYGTVRRYGWLPKHAGEVLADYPDLPGVE